MYYFSKIRYSFIVHHDIQKYIFRCVFFTNILHFKKHIKKVPQTVMVCGIVKILFSWGEKMRKHLFFFVIYDFFIIFNIS